jgi:hypothetical protein
MNHDRELVRRGVIVPVFKSKPPTDILNFKFKDKYYLSYLKARSKVRALKLGNTEEWKKYCYLHKNQSSDYKAPKKSNYLGRCNAITKAGTQCKRNSSSGSNYCWQHK